MKKNVIRRVTTQERRRQGLPPIRTVIADESEDISETDVEPSASGAGAVTGTGMSVFLTDPDVLDCSICMEPLTPPVFQCENGHIACSPCCTKLCKRCPSCSMPIGNNRCLAIEKVIESIKVFCRYEPDGCEEKISYMKKHKHEEKCIYAPCMCPYSDCNFNGSSKHLSRHFSSKHGFSAWSFQYNCPFSVSLGKLKAYLVFQAEDGPLFVLENQAELIGNLIRVVCLQPSSSRGMFLYCLTAGQGGRTLKLKTHMICVKDRTEALSGVDFLLVPCEFCCSSGELKLEICIWRFASERADACPS